MILIVIIAPLVGFCKVVLNRHSFLRLTQETSPRSGKSSRKRTIIIVLIVNLTFVPVKRKLNFENATDLTQKKPGKNGYKLIVVPIFIFLV